jgi:hypothetical protein
LTSFHRSSRFVSIRPKNFSVHVAHARGAPMSRTIRIAGYRLKGGKLVRAGRRLSASDRLATTVGRYNSTRTATGLN